ncbi:hypothetical protein D3C78_918830 [compost metagenome]
MHTKLDDSQRKAIDRQQCMISLQQRLINGMAADIAPIYNNRDSISVRSCKLRLGDIAAKLVIGILGFDRKHHLGRIGAVHRSDNLQAVSRTNSTKQHISVMLEGEGDSRMGKRYSVHIIGYMPKLRLNRLHIFKTSRRIIEQILDRYICSLRRIRRLVDRDVSAFYHDLSG